MPEDKLEDILKELGKVDTFEFAPCTSNIESSFYKLVRETGLYDKMSRTMGKYGPAAFISLTLLILSDYYEVDAIQRFHVKLIKAIRNIWVMKPPSPKQL